MVAFLDRSFALTRYSPFQRLRSRFTLHKGVGLKRPWLIKVSKQALGPVDFLLVRRTAWSANTSPKCDDQAADARVKRLLPFDAKVIPKLRDAERLHSPRC